MPPRENQNYNPAASPALARRVSSIDGIAPRSMERPLLNRPTAARPQSYPRPTDDNRPQPVALPVNTVLQPVRMDEVKLALAGPTPSAPAAIAGSQPLTFAPPPKAAPQEEAPKKRRIKKLITVLCLTGRRVICRKVLVPASIVAAVALAGWGVYAAVQYSRTQASPDTIYRDALANALMTKQVQINQQSDSGRATVLLDLTSLKSPRISSNTTATIAGASFVFNTYGTAQDSFMTYTSLPTGLSTPTVTAVTNHWVKLRQAGQLPAAINMTISNPADPRYQAFGPLLFANLNVKTSQTIARFLVDHKVYGYSLAHVQKVSLNGKKALVFTGKFDADYSKIANQSVATSEGFSVNDVQRVVDSLTVFKGASSALYVDPGKRLPMRLVLTMTSGQTVTYDYSKFNNVKLPTQPTSSINWPQFASTELQIEAQASALQTPAQRDIMRQTDLITIQTALTQYYSRNGFYPSLANLNNQSWLATNLPNFDPDTTRDPQAGTLALLAVAPPATNSKVQAKTIAPATPIYGYIYQPTTVAGEACANETTTPTARRCVLYNLTATLSSGQLYTIRNPQQSS